uniref:Putative secreted protein n=1 Tax=Xenopsylla cheopis TaxID=163159 RepID=A0A6M2DZR4_XENCH
MLPMIRCIWFVAWSSLCCWLASSLCWLPLLLANLGNARNTRTLFTQRRPKLLRQLFHLLIQWRTDNNLSGCSRRTHRSRSYIAAIRMRYPKI